MLKQVIQLVQTSCAPSMEKWLSDRFPENTLVCSSVGSCPGASSVTSEEAQGYGCLPCLHDIVQMKVKHNKTWACHNDETKPCLGGLKELRRRNIPHKPSGEFLTLQDDWENYI